MQGAQHRCQFKGVDLQYLAKHICSKHVEARAKLRYLVYLALHFSRKRAKRLLLLNEVQAVLGDAGAGEPATS